MPRHAGPNDTAYATTISEMQGISVHKVLRSRCETSGYSGLLLRCYVAAANAFQISASEWQAAAKEIKK